MGCEHGRGPPSLQGLDAASLLAPAAGPSTADEADESDEDGGDGLEAAFKRERQREGGGHDAAMERYVERELAARLGKSDEAGDADAASGAVTQDIMVSDEFRRKEEREAGAAWIAGIAEVALPVTERVKNIEETEAAKKRMLAQAGLLRCVDVRGVWGAWEVRVCGA